MVAESKRTELCASDCDSEGNSCDDGDSCWELECRREKRLERDCVDMDTELAEACDCKSESEEKEEPESD